MEDCIFCKIVRSELPSFEVYENDSTFAFLDIRPVNPGHTLVVPKKHSKNIFDISEEDWLSVQKTVRLLSHAVEKGVGAAGININMNNREHAGQVVPHTHVHIIPRKTGDGLKLWPQQSYSEGEANATAEKIRGQIGR